MAKISDMLRNIAMLDPIDVGWGPCTLTALQRKGHPVKFKRWMAKSPQHYNNTQLGIRRTHANNPA